MQTSFVLQITIVLFFQPGSMVGIWTGMVCEEWLQRWGRFFIRALFSESSNSFLGGIVQIGCIHNRQTRVSDNLLGVINVGSFKTNNQRDLQLDTFAGVDDTIGDGGTVNDATENIDENGFNFWIFSNDSEGLLYLRLLHVAPYVEEVSWFPSIQLQMKNQEKDHDANNDYFNDVHGGHRQPRAVDQASNVSFKLDTEIVSNKASLLH